MVNIWFQHHLAESQYSCMPLYFTWIQFKLQNMGLCCYAGFDIGETLQRFDRFQTVMEGNRWGAKGDRKEKWSGGRWVWQRRNLGCSMSHKGGLQGKWKGVGEDRLISVFVKIETGAGWLHEPHQDGEVIQRDELRRRAHGNTRTMQPFRISYTYAQIMSSNTAKRLSVYGYLMKHPVSHLPPNLFTSMRVQWKRKRKVGHVCRFNEAKKLCMTSLCFLVQLTHSLQKTDSILFWHAATELSVIDTIS